MKRRTRNPFVDGYDKVQRGNASWHSKGAAILRREEVSVREIRFDQSINPKEIKIGGFGAVVTIPKKGSRSFLGIQTKKGFKATHYSLDSGRFCLMKSPEIIPFEDIRGKQAIKIAGRLKTVDNLLNKLKKQK